MRPTSCTLSGSPSALNPAGTLIAGWPVRLNSGVNGVKRPAMLIASGAGLPKPPSAPIAVVAVPGVTQHVDLVPERRDPGDRRGAAGEDRGAAPWRHEIATARCHLARQRFQPGTVRDLQRLFVDAAQPGLDELDLGQPVVGVALGHVVAEIAEQGARALPGAALLGARRSRSDPAGSCARSRSAAGRAAWPPPPRSCR